MSEATTIKVTSFVVAASPLEATIKPGKEVTFAIVVTPDGGAFDKRVLFQCPEHPGDLYCWFTPPTEIPNSSPLSTTLTVTQYSQTASAVQRHSTKYPVWTVASLLLGGVLILPKRRWRRTVMLLALMGSLALYSCGGGNENKGGGGGGGAKTYVITVEASSGTLTKSVQISLTVQ